MIPDGWDMQPLKAIALVTSGGTPSRTKPHYWNGDIPWVRTTEVQNCVICQRSIKEFITQEGLNSSSAKIIPAGSILMAMIGQGKTRGQVALLSIDAACNQNSAAIVFQDGYSSEFFFNYLKSQYQNIRNFSNSAGQSNLSGALVKAIKVPVPPLPEQKKIAQILSTWDKAIETVEELIANSQQKKKALMQQLLTGKKRFSGFDGEWKKMELGKLLDYKQPTPFLVKSTKYSDEYATPVLTAGKTFILGHTNESFGVYEEDLPVIIFDDFTTASKFVDFPFKAKSSAMKILTAKQGISIKYIFEAMQMINYSVGGHQRHWISIYSNLVINLPSIEEQQKISSALSSTDQEIKTWKQELEHLKQEKKALMQQLLTGKRRVKIDEILS